MSQPTRVADAVAVRELARLQMLAQQARARRAFRLCVVPEPHRGQPVAPSMFVLCVSLTEGSRSRLSVCCAKVV